MAQDYSRFIKSLNNPDLKQQELLAPYTTFGIGGRADLFLSVSQTAELQKTVKLAKVENIPILVIGAGSNLLISDEGFRGLVIRISNNEFTVHENEVYASAGMLLNKLVKNTSDHRLSGLEFLAGIPGSVGGAVVGNAGAWGKGIGDKISAVEILDDQNKIVWLPVEDCQFAYRDSVFKRKTWIVLNVKFVLSKGDKNEIDQNIYEVLEKRKSLPTSPSAGCIFVNPKPLVAGKLVEECGLIGKSIGGAQISPQHGNFIVNIDGAKAHDVTALIKEIKNEVKKKYGVDLKEEVRLVGF